MAKILTTKGSAAELEDLIRRAQKELYLISFHFIISDLYISRLKQAAEKGVNIKLIYGKSIRQDSLDKLSAIPNIRIYYFHNLHAKIYANETKCIIGSMNFSEASEMNNTELGVLLTRSDDPEAFEDAVSHCSDILKEAEPQFHQRQTANNPPTKQSYGYCIRTGQKISLNHERPFCREAYHEWAEWENYSYPERYCHFTGERSNGQTTMAHPVLAKNWERYQFELTLP